MKGPRTRRATPIVALALVAAAITVVVEPAASAYFVGGCVFRDGNGITYFGACVGSAFVGRCTGEGFDGVCVDSPWLP